MKSSRGSSEDDHVASLGAIFLKPFARPIDALFDHDLSKLGDALLNLVYSLSLSILDGSPTGKKLPNSILSRSLETSRHATLIPRRSDRHQRGDMVEAAFAYAWLRGVITIGTAAKTIAYDCQHESGPDSEKYSKAFSKLLDEILDELEIGEDA